MIIFRISVYGAYCRTVFWCKKAIFDTKSDLPSKFGCSLCLFIFAHSLARVSVRVAKCRSLFRWEHEGPAPKVSGVPITRGGSGKQTCRKARLFSIRIRDAFSSCPCSQSKSLSIGSIRADAWFCRAGFALLVEFRSGIDDGRKVRSHQRTEFEQQYLQLLYGGNAGYFPRGD